jgi:hypothetical protein
MPTKKGSAYNGRNPKEYLQGWLDGYEVARNAAEVLGIDIEHPDWSEVHKMRDLADELRSKLNPEGER